MAEKDDKIGYLNVGRAKVGIIGLPTILEEAKEKNFQDDEELEKFLLEKVKAMNYVPSSAEEKYSMALLKEYKKFMGILDEDDVSDGTLEIKILGLRCYSCEKVEQETMSAVAEMNIPANIEFVDDLAEMERYGVLGTPALIINNKVKSVGRVLRKEEIKKLISEELKG